MAATPVSDKKKNADADKDLLPPDERFWQRYSGHHEFPLSGVGSFVVHGLVIGTFALGYFLLTQARQSESNRPPSMDMVRFAPGDGLPFGGGGDGDDRA